jgi:hypothetical protein
VKRFPFGWTIAALLLSLSAWPLISFYKTPGIVIAATWLICAFFWGFVLLHIIKPEAMENAGRRLNELRRAPAVALLLSLVLLLVILMLWGIIILPEFSLFSTILYFILLAILWGWGSSREDRARIGAAFERSRAANGLIALLSIFLIFAFIELGMRYLTIYPDGFAVTLQFTTWYDRYYTPLNEFGNRGYEARTPAEGQQSILVIGDSYAAGHGINDLDKVFAYQAGQILGDDYIVNLNAGIGISPTVAEFVAPYPVAPDILVLSHFINDIEHTARPGEATYLEFAPDPLMHWFASRYFLFSFLYWHYVVGPQMVSSYANELLAAYDDEAKWAAHEARLQEFVDYANERGIPLLVIVWPTLNDLDLSAEVNQRVEDFFSSRGATIVTIRPAIAELSVEQRMINNFDAHPSEMVHGLVAQALAEAILNLNQNP